MGIDLTGRHSQSRRSNYYILTYIDHFTKWAEAFPIPIKEDPTVCIILVEEVFPGMGSLFKSSVIRTGNLTTRCQKGICILMGSTK